MNTERNELRKATFFIEGRFPNSNQLVDAAKRATIFYARGKRKRVDQYWKLKKEWTQKVKKQVKSLNIEMFEKPVSIKYSWLRKSKTEDPDNISGGGRKVILDGLVDAGVLRADGWKETEPGDTNRYRKCAKGEKEGVWIEICEVDLQKEKKGGE